MTRTPSSREEKLNKLYAEVERLECRLKLLEDLNPAPTRDATIEAVKLDMAEKKAEIARLEEDM